MTITHDAAKQFTTLRDLIADTAADLSAANPYWTAGCLADALIRTGQLVLVDDEAVERVAVRLWRADAERAAPNVARSRNAEAFKNESTVTREKWIGLASAALAALQVEP